MNTATTNPMEEMPVYQAPSVTTYTASDLMNLIGPIHAGSVSPDCDDVLGNCGAGYYAPEDDDSAKIS